MSQATHTKYSSNDLLLLTLKKYMQNKRMYGVFISIKWMAYRSIHADDFLSDLSSAFFSEFFCVLLGDGDWDCSFLCSLSFECTDDLEDLRLIFGDALLSFFGFLLSSSLEEESSSSGYENEEYYLNIIRFKHFFLGGRGGVWVYINMFFVILYSWLPWAQTHMKGSYISFWRQFKM